MMLIPVRPGPSSIHGIGLFAQYPITAGTEVWHWTPGFDRTFSESEYRKLPEIARRHMEHYGSLHAASGEWRLGGDLSIFMNHSSTPNTGAPSVKGPAFATYALRDILAGEELTCDYSAFDNSEKPLARNSNAA